MDDQIINNNVFISENEAVAYDNVNRIILYLLDAWCSFTGKRKEWYGKDIRHSLPIIEFEKLSIFAARVWNNLHKKTSGYALGVSFPFPYEELPGKHGYSLGKSNYHPNGEPAYFSDILIAQSRAGVRLCFRFEIPEEKKESYKTMVSPAIKLPSEEKLFDKFNAFEKKVLRDIYSAIKHLSVGQIRALGTHDSEWRAIKDVHYEAIKWRALIKNVLDRLNAKYDYEEAYILEVEAQKMLEYANEAWRKSLYNRQEYGEARDLILQELSDTSLIEAIKECHGSVDNIWGCPEMVALTSEATIAYAISQYIRGIAYFRHYPDDLAEKKRQFKECWHQAMEGLETLRGQGITTLPALNEVFVAGSPDLKEGIVERLRDIINTCKTFLELKEY